MVCLSPAELPERAVISQRNKVEGGTRSRHPNTLKLVYPEWPYPPSPQHNSSIVLEVQAGTVIEVALLQSDVPPP